MTDNSETSKEDAKSEKDNGCLWFSINAPLLSGIGLGIFLLLLEFGREGYTYIIYTGIIMTLLVGVTCWYHLKEKPNSVFWTLITIKSYLATICAISIYLNKNMDVLLYGHQVATGGIAILFFCLISIVIGPVVAIFAATLLS